MPGEKRKAMVYLLITFSAWGCLYVAGKSVMEQIPPFTVCLIRYAIAGLALLPVLRLRKGRKKRIEPRDYPWIALVGILGYTVSMGAQMVGTELAGASRACLINSMNPVAMLLFAALLLRERLTAAKGISMVFAVAGVFLLLGGGGEKGRLAGILVSLFAMVSWSFVSVMVRRITQKYDPLQITAYGMLLAALCTLPLSAAEIAGGREVTIDLPAVASLLFMGLICTALAHVCWNRSLSMMEAGPVPCFIPFSRWYPLCWAPCCWAKRWTSVFSAGRS